MTTEQTKQQTIIDRIKEHLNQGGFVTSAEDLKALKSARFNLSLGAMIALEAMGQEISPYWMINMHCSRLDRVFGELPGEFEEVESL